MTALILGTSVFITDAGEHIMLDPAHHAGVRLPSTAGYGVQHRDCDDRGFVQYLRAVDTRVALGVHLIRLNGGEVAHHDVLVIGSSDGAEVACLLAQGARSVIGTDFGDAFLSRAHQEQQQALLNRARRMAAPLAWPPIDPARALFRCDDITSSSLEDASFDIIMSWQTLEHIPDIAACMRESSRLLRPGGFVYHEYNPFFSIDGGHSAGTLDMPWGHVRLTQREITRYLNTIRPDEAPDALRFLTDALNRATQSDIQSAARSAGLDVVTWLPRTRTEDVLLLTPQIMKQATRVYPDITIADLSSRIVRGVFTRPA